MLVIAPSWKDIFVSMKVKKKSVVIFKKFLRIVRSGEKCSNSVGEMDEPTYNLQRVNDKRT